MSGYNVFAEYYDELTHNINYKEKANYILEILKRENKAVDTLIDLACGTGSLSVEFAEKGIDVIGIDSSVEMLSVAQQKLYDKDYNILFVNQKMQNFVLHGPVDAITCCLDSINHLSNISDVEKTFKRVSKFLKNDGYFFFDVNTIYKHKFVLANNTFVYDLENIYCVWQNTLEEETNQVKIELDFFEKQGSVYKRSSEMFYESVYTPEQLEKCLVSAGMSLVCMYEDMTFCVPKDSTEKVLYVAKKAI